ncbi:nitric oxide reductase activation protein NorD [Nocardia jiangsuensis]|uniref:Nitric oxide reductase activation protein NorD n=1 Tax=Nocardia jiangsuensis TaxID=1691563 RepID=A0ABV8E165_9NOCA
MNPRALERGCALTAVAFSARRRANARLLTGAHRGFGLNAAGTVVQVPYPPAPGWTRTTLTCGVALQCAPSKDALARYALHELSPRERGALTLIEGGVAAGWIADRLPGLIPELRLRLPDLPFEPDLDVPAMLERADRLARSGTPLPAHPLLGTLPLSAPGRSALAAAVHRTYGRMPWTSRRSDAKRVLSIPVGGDGGARTSNLPPPSHPDNEDLDLRADRRAGIPYPEWNMWTESFLPDHVAVLERTDPTRGGPARPVGADLRRWFEQRTHRALRGGLPDGADLDVDRYVAHRLDALGGPVPEPRVFRDLLPTTRDVTTAVLLDGSSSLGSNGGRAFRLELACADALSRAMALAGERHGLFVFTGNTRHRVEVRCLRDFDDRHSVDPGGLGLMAGGYTRLGAPLRHLTHRLAERPAERRLLLVIGDGLMSDEGYEGRYAWADVAHALTEADEAGITVYYIGVGPVRVDPLPEVFGPRRSCRIHRVEQLPRVLGAVHRTLVAA